MIKLCPKCRMENYHLIGKCVRIPKGGNRRIDHELVMKLRRVKGWDFKRIGEKAFCTRQAAWRICREDKIGLTSN